MKKYYLTDGKENLGPFSINELKEKNLSKDSYVWFEELDDWKEAGEVEELAELFALAPVATQPIESPPIQPPPIVAQPPTANQRVNGPAKPVANPPKIWPKILVAMGLPIAIFVALLLTGVIKIPGFLEGSIGSGVATGNPESDALIMIIKQEEFARVANEAARDGVIDVREMNNLEKMYKDILVFFGSYAGNREAQERMDQYIDGNHSDRAEKAEIEFSNAMVNLMDCEGFDELNLRMQNLVDRLNINFDDY